MSVKPNIDTVLPLTGYSVDGGLLAEAHNRNPSKGRSAVSRKFNLSCLGHLHLVLDPFGDFKNELLIDAFICVSLLIDADVQGIKAYCML
jgi:hypothetical protein